MKSSGPPNAGASPLRSPSGSRRLAGVVLAVAVVGAVGAAGCSSAPDRPPDAVAGKGLFQARCAACHALPVPRAYSAVEWRGIVRKMGPRAGLGPAGQKDILEFVLQEEP